MLILVESTRRGQLPDIAAYSAGTSVGAVASALVGSGTSLAYVTGDPEVQSGVRRVRQLVVAPIMFLAVLAASLVYIRTTELAALSILMGGASAVLNNLAELDSASLERKLDTPRLLVGSVMSRVFGLVMVLSGASFSSAMLGCALLMYAAYRLFARPHTRPDNSRPRLVDALRMAYSPSLVGQSVVGIVVMRATLVVAPFIMPATHAGALSSLISVQQAVTGVLVAALYTVMAAHSEAREELGWMRRVASWTLFSSAIVGLGAALSAPLVLGVLRLGDIPGAALWWVVLSLAVFPYVVVRRFQYRALGAGKRVSSLIVMGFNASLTLLVVVIAVTLRSSDLLVASSLLAEGGVALGIAGCVAFRRVSAAPESRHGEAPNGR